MYSKRQDVFIYEVPKELLHKTCQVIDNEQIWYSLALKMGYGNEEINRIESKSIDKRSELLLSMWSDHNHTVTELFMIFYQLKMTKAMEILRSCVDNAYHRLIRTKSKEKRIRVKKGDEERKPIVNGLPKIAYRELVDGTSKWNEQNVLGRGGFATVYKGKWKGTPVAIKRIHHQLDNSFDDVENNLREIQLMSAYRQDNILPVYGFSLADNETCLVYQLMTGGTLQQKLRNSQAPLTPEQRMNIANGVARGLWFLHSAYQTPLIHGDIKPANILLDENCLPKIGDFGLARLCHSINESMEVSTLCGTSPYMAPELKEHCIISTKTDSYSFGVVLLEIATNLPAIDANRGPLTQYVRQCRLSEFNNNETSSEARVITIALLLIGKKCTNLNAKSRLEMNEILRYFDGNKFDRLISL